MIERGPDGPIVMVNLLKYRSKAAYEPDRPVIARPDYLAATHHREAGLERTALLCCAAGTAS